MDATTGPRALARAPNDLKIPRIVPLWCKSPYWEIMVVMQVTTNAVAGRDRAEDHLMLKKNISEGFTYKWRTRSFPRKEQEQIQRDPL